MNDRIYFNDLYQAILCIEGNDKDAMDVLTYMTEQVEQGGDAEEILYEYGLEPDYVVDLINLMNPY